MAIQKLALTKTLVCHLYELACTPFRLRTFCERWRSFAWSYEQGNDDEFGFCVNATNAGMLFVDPLGETVLGARLPFYLWEEYEPTLHSNSDEFRRQRQAYDAEFENASSLALHALPAPLMTSTDNDDHAHKAVVWEGQQGLLILQQACFDPQIGLEIDFWLENCSPQDFRPTTPLIDWLCKRSQRAHAKHGFPALRW